MRRIFAPKACSSPSCSSALYPHARVLHIDASEALAMPGVKGMITMDDLPAPADSVTDLGAVIKADPRGERGLAMEPVFQGEPILALAAVDEVTAADAIEKIKINYEPLPYVVDPFVSSAARRPQRAHRRQHLDAQAGSRHRRPARNRARRRRSTSPRLSGPKRISRITPKAKCPWASRPTNGTTAIGKRASRTRRSFSMKPSHAEHQPSVPRDAHGHGVLAGRQAVHARRQPKHCRRQFRPSPAG